MLVCGQGRLGQCGCPLPWRRRAESRKFHLRSSAVGTAREDEGPVQLLHVTISVTFSTSPHVTVLTVLVSGDVLQPGDFFFLIYLVLVVALGIVNLLLLLKKLFQ